MTSITLYYHPLSSYCHKVLIALAELGIDAEKHLLNLGDPVERAAFLALWPTGKMPLLLDQGRPVAETSIIIEHLQLHHAATGHTLIPHDSSAALQVRLWDRLMDQYVMTPMQKVVLDRMRPAGDHDGYGVAQARELLDKIYPWLDEHLAGRTWAAGEAFSLADCGAAPFLFYADWTHPIDTAFANVRAYRQRLLARPSFARAVDEARPYRPLFPLGAPDRD